MASPTWHTTVPMILFQDDSFLDKVKNVFGVSSREDGEPEEKSILMNSRVDAEVRYTTLHVTSLLCSVYESV